MTTAIVRRPLITDTDKLPGEMPDLLRRIYAARGLESAEELDYSLDRLLPLDRLGGLERAADLLYQALREGQRIVIVGDFDADGATSSALCVHALAAMGASDVHYLVPNRFEYGYGLTPEIVEVAADLRPDLIVTVDNGVSSIEGVEAARCHGIGVLVTDHHLPGEQLPRADVIVNPNLPGDPFPSKSMAGVGVAFYVMLALRACLREHGWFERQEVAEPNLADYLDLVALGTVADVVRLDRNNRILVSQGIARIRAGKCRPGILALIAVAKRDPSRLVAADLGFAVAPRLNAAGRLDEMSLGIECLLANGQETAMSIAMQLDELNRERRDIEAGMQREAMEAVQSLHIDARRLPTGLCLFNRNWHQGVVGILASRLKERYHRPVIAFAQVNETELKGSARSVAGLHIRDVLDAIAAHHPGLILKFGGHAMAAGLSLERGKYEIFRKAFDEEVRSRLAEDELRDVIHSDGSLGGNELTLESAERLRGAGPWGQGFPEPVFDGVFEVLDYRVVGEKHLKLSVRVPGSEEVIDAIAFGQGKRQRDMGSGRVRLAYRLDVNEYRGFRRPQLIVEHLEIR